MKIAVVLEVMWGATRKTRAPRWYKINPHNHSGKRLIKLLGHDDFMVTNACPEYVTAANEKGIADPAWLRENLRQYNPDMVLVCGGVARRTFFRDMVRPGSIIALLPHPAARGWTKAGIAAAAKALALKQDATLTMTGE
jgi:hypothetical protein